MKKIKMMMWKNNKDYNIYLINKASGGLAHMLGGIYAALTYVKQNNRFLIIDCETHTAFRHKFLDYFTK